MNRTFASLSVYNYRVYFMGAMTSNIGTWIGRIAQDWLVLTVLTDHNATALGFVTALQFAPAVLLAPVAGALTDRYSKRKVQFLAQGALAVTSAILATLVLTGAVQLWHVFLTATLQGFATALNNPSRQAMVSEMVPPELVTNAVSLNSTSFNAARIVGPGIAGLLVGIIGIGPTILFDTFSFVAVMFSLYVMRPGELMPAPRSRGKGKVREGMAYVRHRPDIMLILVMIFMLGTFGMNFQLTTALMATAVFHENATGFGLLGSIMAIGSLGGALMSARRSRPRLRVLMTSLAGFTVASAAAALAPSFLLFAVLLIPTGFAAITFLNTANSTVQLSVSPVMRGRVMALYMAVFLGGTPVGAPLIGWVGDTFGARWTILIGSVATLVTLGAAMAYLLRSKDLYLRIERTPRPHLEVRPRDVASAAEPERVA